MRIILLKDIKGLGKKGEVQEVKSGYARNLLIPGGKAEPATAEKEAQARKRQEKAEASKEAEKEEKKKLIVEMEGVSLSFPLKVDKKGNPFGSIQAKDIEQALEKKGYKEVEVKQKAPLKELGEHKVEVSLGEGAKGEVGVTLLPQP